MAAPPQQAQAPSRSESSASQGSGSLASSDPIMAAANRYRQIALENPSQAKFLKGWLRRAADLGRDL